MSFIRNKFNRYVGGILIALLLLYVSSCKKTEVTVESYEMDQIIQYFNPGEDGWEFVASGSEDTTLKSEGGNVDLPRTFTEESFLPGVDFKGEIKRGKTGKYFVLFLKLKSDYSKILSVAHAEGLTPRWTFRLSEISRDLVTGEVVNFTEVSFHKVDSQLSAGIPNYTDVITRFGVTGIVDHRSPDAEVSFQFKPLLAGKEYSILVQYHPPTGMKLKRGGIDELPYFYKDVKFITIDLTNAEVE